MAWALSQILVVSEVGVNLGGKVEAWVTYYDIFVRNAFGSMRDVLREVCRAAPEQICRTRTCICSTPYAHLNPRSLRWECRAPHKQPVPMAGLLQFDDGAHAHL